jgi:hypothetical protein
MAVMAGPIRVTRLDSDGCPTEETVEIDAFCFTFTETPSDGDGDLLDVNALKEAHFTVDLCWAPGGRKRFIETVAGVEFWKKSERTRKRYANRARKVKKRQR